MATVVLVLTWLAVAVKARRAWQPSAPPARRLLWLALLALALGWTLRVPAGYRGLDAVTGIPNLAQLIGDALALAAGSAVLGMLMHQREEDPDRAARAARRRAYLWVVSVAAMAGAFVAGSPDVETEAFVLRYGEEPFFIAYTAPYLAFLLYIFVDLARLSTRYAGRAERPRLRRGLRIIAAAGVAGIAYVGLRAVAVVIAQAQVAADLRTYERISDALVALVTVLAVVGASWSTVGDRIADVVTYNRLRPLWRTLQRATPEIAASPPRPGWRDALDPRRLRLRLHSRHVEIRDGRLALRPYLRRDVVTAARRRAAAEGLAGTEAAAVVEAAVVGVAASDKVDGRLPPQEARAQESRVPGSDNSMVQERAFLVRVAQAFSRSPWVRGRRGHRGHG